MANEKLNKIAEAPESVIIHNDDELYEKILKSEEDIRLGKVIPYEDFRREVFEKYGF